MYEELPSLGSTVGAWLILERLGSGNFGVVFRARRADLPESPPVALKLAKQPEDPRFEREAEVLQHHDHPSIPRYEGMGLWTGPLGQDYPYLVMECVQGLTLYNWFRQQQRSSLDVLQVAVQLAGALASAHGRGVIHRDVKGDNIRVTSKGRAVLLDWGSCWLPSARPLTDTPVPPGTSAYRPPEQRGFIYTSRKDVQARWQSRPPDDLYALGVTLYRLVTGTYLPPCTDGVGLVERQVLRPSTMATVSPVLETLILRLISDDREARGTAEQLVREAMSLVQAGGTDAQKPILPAPSAQPAEEIADIESSSARGECRPLPTFPVLAGAFMMGGVVMALLVLPVRPVPEETPPSWTATPEKVAQFAPDAGVGDEALARFQEVPRVMMALSALGRPMPKTPFPSQSRPPCVDPEFQRVINGGCWVAIKGKEPPCGKSAFDYGDECFMPVYDAPRSPTSEEPR